MDSIIIALLNKIGLGVNSIYPGNDEYATRLNEYTNNTLNVRYSGRGCEENRVVFSIGDNIVYTLVIDIDAEHNNRIKVMYLF